jgi:hypothetical protein
VEGSSERGSIKELNFLTRRATSNVLKEEPAL